MIRTYAKVTDFKEIPCCQGVYILHFEEKLCHAQHYIGYASNIKKRLEAHKSNTSNVRLIQVLHEKGIEFILSAYFPGADRTFERYLKDTYKNAALICGCKRKNITKDGRKRG